MGLLRVGTVGRQPGRVVRSGRQPVRRDRLAARPGARKRAARRPDSGRASAPRRARARARRGARPGPRGSRPRPRRRGRARRWAPASAAQPTAASVAAPRSRGARPVIAPRKSLRETASRSGRPERVQLVEAAQHGDGLRGRLGEVRPGVEQDLLLPHPGARPRPPCASARSSRTSPHDVGVGVRVEQRALGRHARVHDHEPGPRARADRGERRIAPAGHVVDERRARGHRGLRDGRLVRVHGDHHVELGGDPLHHRHHARELLLGPGPAGARPRPTPRRRRGSPRPPRRARARAPRAPRARAARRRPRTSPASR